MQNRTLRYYLSSRTHRKMLPEEAETQKYTYFSDYEIAEFERHLPKLNYWLKAIQGLLPMQDSMNHNAMHNTNMVFFWDGNRGSRQKMFPLSKMTPARKRTLTTIEEIFERTAHSSNVYAHTCLCYNRKEIDTTSRNIAACYTMVVDIDNLPEINQVDENGKYVMSGEATASYLFSHPRFSRFFKMLPPSMIVRTGKKGAQIYFVFRQNVRNEKRRFERIHQALVRLFHADAAVGSLFSIVRMPYSSRVSSKPSVQVGQPDIVYLADKIYSFGSFFDVVEDITNHTVIFENQTVEFYFSSEADREYIEEEFDPNARDWGLDGSMVLSAYLDFLGYQADNELSAVHSLPTVHSDITDEMIAMSHKLWDDVPRTAQDAPSETNPVSDLRTPLPQSLNGLPRHSDNWKSHGKPSKARSAVEQRKMKIFHKNRDYDIKKLVALRDFNVTGYRDLILYNYAANLSFMKLNDEDITRKVKEMNRSFSCPLREHQVDSLLRYIFLHKGFVQVKSDFELCRTLDIAASELSYMLNTYTPEAKEQHRKETLSRRNQEARKARADEKIRQTARQISVIFRTIKETGSVKDTCEKTKIARSTVYRLVKSMGETVKKGKKKSALLEYLKGLIEKALRNKAFSDLFTLHIPKQDNLFFYDFPQYTADCSTLYDKVVPT